MFRALRHQNYRRFYGANFVSNTGTWAQRIAQDWLVLELTKSPTLLGITVALQFLPIPLFSMHAGVLADRFSKRKLLILANAVGFITALTLGLLNLFEVVEIWHVMVLAFLLGTAAAVDGPARQSFIVELVGPEDLPNAFGLNSLNFNLGRLVGPAASGLMIAAFGTAWSFIFNATSYLFVMAALLTMNPKKFFGGKRSDDTDKSIRQGLRYIKKRPDLQAILVVVGLMATFGLNFQIHMALFTRNIFERGPEGFGLLASSLAIGSVTGALISAKRQKPTVRLVVFGAIAFGVSQMVTALAPTYEVFALLLPICGASALITVIAANSTLQLTTPGPLRGRVTGVYLVVFLGGTPFGSPIIGWLAGAISPRFTMFMGGVITALSGIFVYYVFRERLWRNPEELASDGAGDDESKERKEHN
jgi:MFS family permease